MLSKGSESSISLATVTPSLVTDGEGLLEHDVAARGAEGDAHGLGELLDAVAHLRARRVVEQDLLGHGWGIPWRSCAGCVRWCVRGIGAL
jgi:hypothetical protein